jgi:hypothetical protein
MKGLVNKTALLHWLWNFHYDHPNPLLSRVHEEIESGRLDIKIENQESALPFEEWHEECGVVLWWKFPIEEPPYCGTPLDSDWKSDYYTHWTPIIIPKEMR